MADPSKYLPHQDKNADGSIDICDIETPPEEPVCLECVPNPKAVIPNWRNRTRDEPILNEKTCKYQITMGTKYTTTSGESWTTTSKPEVPEITEIQTTAGETVEYVGSAAVASPHPIAIDDELMAIFDEHATMAIIGLLEFALKSTSMESQDTVREALEYTIYDLDPAPNSYLKLLYSVPFDIINNIEDESAGDDESAEDEEPEAASLEISSSDLVLKTIRVRKAMSLYNRYLKVYRAIDGGNLFYDESIPAGGREPGTAPPQTLGEDAPRSVSHEHRRIFNLENYGDPVLLTSSTLGDLVLDLDRFLNSKGYNLPGTGQVVFFKDTVIKIKFSFAPGYQLQRIRLWTDECPDGSIYFIKGQTLDTLLRKGSWRDQTAVAYLAQIEGMERDITARVPKPWLDFLLEYTYPKIFSTVNEGKATTDDDRKDTAWSCIGKSLEDEAKQFGQDILDDVFSIGDAIAYLFHKNLCRADLDEMLKDDIDLGIIFDPNGGDVKNIWGAAQMQAFKRLEADDQIFMKLCARMMGSSLPLPGNTLKNIDDLWSKGFEKIKVCGLFELLMQAIKCLFGGLSLEEALAKMVKAALEGMGVENMGDLFVGLPPEKQEELDALVQKKLESGDLPGFGGEEFSDRMEGKLEWRRPWENEKLISKEKASKMESGLDGMVPSSFSQQAQPADERTRRTLAQQWDSIGAPADAGDESILAAYVQALLEVYGTNLLELVDELNNFPGARIISFIIAMFDCPRPPIMSPSLLDFLKDIELPFCNNLNELTLPRLENPFAWIPPLTDLLAMLWQIIKYMVQMLVITIIFKLLVKICELIGSVICKALEITGQLVAGIPDMVAGRTSFGEIVKDSICGPDADSDQIDDTIVDLFANLGVGGAAFADRGQVLNFAEDLSSSVTRRELVGAMMGDPSDAFLTSTISLIEHEYPDYLTALPTKAAVASFTKNVGNLFPTPVRDQMQDFLEAIPPEDELPANPSICASPEKLENFKELRCQLLEGRATPEQCDVMYDSLRGTLGLGPDAPGWADDLEELATVLQSGPTKHLADNLPPIISSAPDCDDGLLPFEPETSVTVANTVLDNTMEGLKVEFSEDMLGNGNFWNADASWGFMNMILSDTRGRPLSAHMRLSGNDPAYVSFYNTWEPDDAEGAAEYDQAPYAKQYGAFPYRVAGWLQDYLKLIESATGTIGPFVGEGRDFESNNSYQVPKTYRKSWDDLGLDTGAAGTDIDLWKLPDLGYNVEVKSDWGAGQVVITRAGRKEKADIKLQFRDNGKGNAAQMKSSFLYGFNLSLYLSDFEGTTNRFDDNARILITNVMNLATQEVFNDDAMAAMQDPDKEDKREEAGQSIIKERSYEFLSVDDGLDIFTNPTDGLSNLSEYPNFASIHRGSYGAYSGVLPQLVLLAEIISNNLPPEEARAPESIKSTYDSIMDTMFKRFFKEVASNDDGFAYGARFDTLKPTDFDYVVDSGDTLSPAGTLYWEASVADDDGGTRLIQDNDMILGVSRMQLETGASPADGNRVFYLNPVDYGGSYMNPPIHVIPMMNKGWLGFVQVMFPDIGPCKPQRTDLVDFSDIMSKVQQDYSKLPEDVRLKQEEECAVELPYNRILERPSKAGLRGIITAAIRIFASVHFIKCLPMFSKIAPIFPESYSSLFAQYIVENMEHSFKDAQNGFWELFNTFKDDEFWLAFLEQSVELYSRLIDSGDIEPEQRNIDMLLKLNDYQDTYDYPDEHMLQTAKVLGDAGDLQGLIGYRHDKNMEAIKATEEYAKLILKELVVIELQYMSEKFLSNMEMIGMQPEIWNLVDFILSKDGMTQGSELDLNKAPGELKPEVASLPSEGSGHYTGGTQLALSTGEDYIGYYHIQYDENGDITYEAGEEHSGEPHETLVPYANIVKMPIGDVSGYEHGFSSDKEKPFGLRKYIRIEDTIYDPDEAMQIIKSHPNQDANISDVYPGTLGLVYDRDAPMSVEASTTGPSPVASASGPKTVKAGETVEAYPAGTSGRVVGLKGELGVRYGLEFSVIMDGEAATVTRVEVDALDFTMASMAPLEADSKLLYCLINLLKDDDKFKLVTKYIFPLSKAAATTAIYTDMAFLPSIGEITVPDKSGALNWANPPVKPGMQAIVTADSSKPVGESFKVDYAWTEGWYAYKDRNPSPQWSNWSWWVKEWDEWDRVLLRNSKSRIKKIFDTYYNSRKFTSFEYDSPSPASIWLKGLKQSLSIGNAEAMLPSFKKKRRRSNPFNADGELCKK